MNDKEYHYVYRITNLVESKHYYGARTSTVEPALDLGQVYFSSSTDLDFIQDQKTNPQNYKYKVVSLFNDRFNANEMEIKLHKKFNVASNPNFYNKAIATSSAFSIYGTNHTEETKLKISKSNKGKTRTNKQKQNISDALSGRKLSNRHIKNIVKHKIGVPRKDNVKAKIANTLNGHIVDEKTKLKISKVLSGRKLSDKHKKNISIGAKNRPKISEETRSKLSKAKSKPQRQLKCPYCNKVGGASNMTRYHFDNCKYKQ